MALIAFIPAIALSVDRIFGEPSRAHPLVAFGKMVDHLESWFRCPDASPRSQHLRGGLAALLLLLPAVCFAWVFAQIPVVGVFFQVVILYLCLGLQSLKEHAQVIADALKKNDIDTAREKTGWIVSRDTANIDETQMVRATIESVLENGNDAVFATLFWFFILGAPGAVLLRCANTLDAMWGYKTQRYLHFGRFAAKLDDVLNWIPARLTAITLALLGNTKQAFHCWKNQARYYSSPNGGPVMTSGAGSLQVILGGGASYHGVWQEKPLMGSGLNPQHHDIDRALALVNRSAWLWVLLYAVIGLFAHA